MGKTKKYAAVGKGCVACGCCEAACPLKAVTIYKGMYAQVDTDRCAGCGKCQKACPASVIAIISAGVMTPARPSAAERGGI